MRRFLILAAFSAAFAALAQNAGAQSWPERKCRLYEQAVEDALAFLGRDGLTERFLTENRAFIENGCETPGHVCPRTSAEVEFANMLTIMTMNEGMASTFVPFRCR